ncbi:MAG: hypothetical protein OXF98_05395 [Rhodospirillaceae bacterium]|nr:hypothetical protein [Rhodospirillaceae bacterium]
MSDDDPQRRGRIRNRALALGLWVLCLYVGFMVLVALSNAGSPG